MAKTKFDVSFVNNIKLTEETLKNEGFCWNFWIQVSSRTDVTEEYLEYFSDYIMWGKVFETNPLISKECFFRHYDGDACTLRTILKKNIPLSEKIISDIGKNGSFEEILAIDVFLGAVELGTYFTTTKIVDEFQKSVVWNVFIPESLRYKYSRLAKKNFTVGDKVHSKFHPRLVIGGREGNLYTLINMETSNESAFDVIFLAKDKIEKGWE